MFDDSCFLGEVTNFHKLGTGHKQRKFVLADQNRRILLIAKVVSNTPLTTGTTRFENNRTFYHSSRTLENQKVSIFPWTEKLERRWQWQREIEKVGRWMESARPEDVIVLAEFV